MRIPVIEGGFGEGQKVILAKTVSEIHGVELKHVNELINKNINRFNENDLLDLCNENFKVVANDLGFITSNRQKYCYLLSERGYTKLVSMMDNNNDLKWQVMDKLIDEYFAMREIVNSIEQQKANLLLSIYSGGQEAVVASKQLVELETKPLLDKIEEDEPKVTFADAVAESADSIDMGRFSKLVKDENVFDGGRNTLFQWLRENKYLNKENIPYQRYINQGIFEVKETAYKTPYGTKISITTLVTGKGQIYLIEKLRKLKQNN